MSLKKTNQLFVILSLLEFNLVRCFFMKEIIKNNLTKFENSRFWILEEMGSLNKKGKLNPKTLSNKTGYSIKQSRRFIKSFKDNTFLISHKNKNKENVNKIKDEVKRAIIEKYIEVTTPCKEMSDGHYEMTHLDFYLDEIKDKFNVKYGFVNKLLNENFLLTSYSKRITRKTMKKKLKEGNLAELKIQEKILEFLRKYKPTYTEYLKTKNPPYVKHNYDFGHIVEVDACVSVWIGIKKYYIYHAIDAGTGKFLGFWMDDEETNFGYCKLLKQVLEKYGAPNIIKTDRRKTFWSENSVTNLTYCLNKLEIQVKSESQPTFKANVERSFKNAQQIYYKLFLKHGLNTKEKIQKNYQLIVDAYNQRYKKSEKGKRNQFIKLSKNDLKDLFYTTKICKVLKGFYFFHNGKAMGLFTKEDKRVNMKNQILLRTNMLTGEKFVLDKNTKYFAREINDDLLNEYINEIQDNEFLKLEKIKRKSIAASKAIYQKNENTRIALERWSNSLKEREEKIKIREIELSLNI
ncbi:transposase for IS1202-like insertion sequence element [Malacoplasma penetrans HF-2]|uniref:Transposase for IS1202-like insertion sequence element n=2 Tax=Malacoplasma penetrans TaxID=28227 RepID=Q8EVM3_MALP2|nr:transposase for IS1202-like insertion sequence element [Malacoplasma penetrans HF-2]